ncbi:hypothetical protein ASS93_07590 [Staphylococcus saprophyticus]|uniref:hypothetical protein n=1 Tax=Staphylococcus TaxID=1279 RepID=UPI000254AF73|nr:MULTISPECIES: hypothetical protein [Staphylococcus]EHY91846.1 putative 2-dehydro-3-deoxyphosphogluconate aldolase [Staphylococcus saprophyticus subsp. saprophyticus KACC 16562]OEK46140.1 hypothetical protein ASS93_07590 [Staphylococcus saprophyticus]
MNINNNVVIFKKLKFYQGDDKMKSTETMKEIQQGQHITVMRADDAASFLDIANTIKVGIIKMRNT